MGTRMNARYLLIFKGVEYEIKLVGWMCVPLGQERGYDMYLFSESRGASCLKDKLEETPARDVMYGTNQESGNPSTWMHSVVGRRSLRRAFDLPSAVSTQFPKHLWTGTWATHTLSECFTAAPPSSKQLELGPDVSPWLGENFITDVGPFIVSFCHASPSATRKINICGDTHYKAVSIIYRSTKQDSLTTYHH